MMCYTNFLLVCTVVPPLVDGFFFRMLETVDGYVKIDGDDVAKLPLSTHRARLNIIPQVSCDKNSQQFFFQRTTH